MSTIVDRCPIFEPEGLEWAYYNVILLWVGFVVARAIHELGHSIANWLAGGIFSLNQLTLSWFLFIPMGTMPYDTSSLLVIYAGPVTAILVGWFVGLNYNFRTFDGPCGRRSKKNKWNKYRGIVSGFLLQALWDSAYLIPLDINPFDNVAAGDGFEAGRIYKEMGLHSVEIAGQKVVTNPEYLISGILLIGTFYVIFQTYRCAPEITERCPW